MEQGSGGAILIILSASIVIYVFRARIKHQFNLQMPWQLSKHPGLSPPLYRWRNRGRGEVTSPNLHSESELSWKVIYESELTHVPPTPTSKWTVYKVFLRWKAPLYFILYSATSRRCSSISYTIDLSALHSSHSPIHLIETTGRKVTERSVVLEFYPWLMKNIHHSHVLWLLWLMHSFHFRGYI